MHQLAIGMVNFTFNFHLYLGLFTHCGPPLLVGGGSVINRVYSSSFRKVQKNFRPYLAIFQKKNANLLGVFLKQYKNGHFFNQLSDTS